MKEKQKLNLNWDKRPKESVVLLYGPDKNYICEITTHYDFEWVRLQIAEQHLDGYYFNWEGKSYDIKSDGSIVDWPGGLYSQHTSIVSKLLNYKSGCKINSIPMSKQIDMYDCPTNPYVDIFDNEDKLICHTNDDLQFKWVCAQIKLKKLHGCYIIFRDQKIMINEYGCPVENPSEMFEYYTDQLIALV
jgi:hypothetical protein